MNKKMIAMVITFTVLLSLTGWSDVFANEDKVNKDETVYGFLDSDGSIRDVLVVNRLIEAIDGSWVDTGNYLSVRAMEVVPEPDLSPGRVIWNLTGKDGQSFYYEGVMNKPLPLNVQVEWFLDGKKVEPSELQDKSGELEWKLSLTQNESLENVLRDGFLTQIQVPLDLDKVHVTDTGNSIATVVGHQTTLSWTLMPGESGDFSFKATVQHFSMDPVTLSLVQYKNPLNSDSSELTSGIKKMEDAGNKLADGTDELKDGLSSLKDGIDTFYTGLQKLSSGTGELTSGLNSTASGMDQYGAGLNQAMAGLGNAASGLVQLQTSSAQLLSGQEATLAGIKELAAGHAQLVLIAETLIQSENPAVQQLAGGVIAEKAGLDQIISGMTQQIDGFKQFHSGLTNAIDGVKSGIPDLQKLPVAFAEMQAGVVKLASGSQEIAKGVKESEKGAGELSGQTASLPENAQKLADGQRELADGLVTMNKEISGMIPNESDKEKNIISFADGKTAIHSLQYIIRIDGVDALEIVKAEGPRNVRLPWYEELLNRLTGLFS